MMKGSRRGSTDVIFLIWATHVLLTLPHTQRRKASEPANSLVW